MGTPLQLPAHGRSIHQMQCNYPFEADRLALFIKVQMVSTSHANCHVSAETRQIVPYHLLLSLQIYMMIPRGAQRLLRTDVTLANVTACGNSESEKTRSVNVTYSLELRV